MDMCLEAGFTAYLSKPASQHQLHECLTRYLSEPSEALDNRSILLVEDDADARTALSALLELMDYQVTAAATAGEALALAREQPPVLILADLNLPDMNGYDLSAELHRCYPAAQIVVISGAEIDADRAQQSGIKQSLLKPVGLDQLRNLLTRL
ncbi:MAG TPA: response regulator, partial [Cellvibrionaceae bacterium]